jgi:pimeloyl-ACP methyl ester carboxylesterase
MADDAIGVLDAYGIDRAHIVGASMGGMITQQIALRHPERVTTITPIMSTPDPSGVAVAAAGGEPTSPLPMPTEAVMAMATTGMTIDWADEAAVINRGVEMGRVLAGTRHPYDEEAVRDVTTREIKRASNYSSIQNHILAIANTPRWREQLANLDVPTLVIHGTEDPILPIEHGRAIAEEIPGAKMLEMDGSGHEIPRPEWDNVIPAILEHTSAS